MNDLVSSIADAWPLGLVYMTVQPGAADSAGLLKWSTPWPSMQLQPPGSILHANAYYRQCKFSTLTVALAQPALQRHGDSTAGVDTSRMSAPMGGECASLRQVAWQCSGRVLCWPACHLSQACPSSRHVAQGLALLAIESGAWHIALDAVHGHMDARLLVLKVTAAGVMAVPDTAWALQRGASCFSSCSPSCSALTVSGHQQTKLTLNAAMHQQP